MHLPIAPNAELSVLRRRLSRDGEAEPQFRDHRRLSAGWSESHARQYASARSSARVTGNFFDVLGMPAQRGRLFKPGEESQKGPLVIVLSDALWRRDFGGDARRHRNERARRWRTRDNRRRRRSARHIPAANVDYFTLLDLDPVGTAPFSLGLEMIGRLRPGLSIDAALNDASRVIQRSLTGESWSACDGRLGFLGFPRDYPTDSRRHRRRRETDARAPHRGGHLRAVLDVRERRNVGARAIERAPHGARRSLGAWRGPSTADRRRAGRGRIAGDDRRSARTGVVRRHRTSS